MIAEYFMNKIARQYSMVIREYNYNRQLKLRQENAMKQAKIQNELARSND